MLPALHVVRCNSTLGQDMPYLQACTSPRLRTCSVSGIELALLHSPSLPQAVLGAAQGRTVVKPYKRKGPALMCFVRRIVFTVLCCGLCQASRLSATLKPPSTSWVVWCHNTACLAAWLGICDKAACLERLVCSLQLANCREQPRWRSCAALKACVTALISWTSLCS